MNKKLDGFFNKADKWQEEMKLLRALVDEFNLEEEVKWMHPCYTDGKANIILIHAFKEYCALLFFKGALMDDPDGILVQQSENVQEGRQMRFTSASEIKKQSTQIKAYIKEAIRVEKAGLKFEYKKTKDFPIPEEFASQLAADKKLKAAFEGLTPGRQRAYLLHFAAAKQSATRQRRIEKYIPAILAGKGIDD